MRRLGYLLLFGAAVLLTVMTYACVPVLQRTTAPVLCPSSTVESVVVAYSTSSGSGKSSFHSDFYCIDPEGGGYQPATTKLMGVMFGYACGFVGITFLVARTVRRLRKKKES